MRFSIITPSFNHSDFLKRCVASVADQGVELEHLVQDAGSTDGTLDWLRSDRRVNARIETDEGMYDAINRGLKRATGDICAYLNCDEQYLPGALAAVEEFFRCHPTVEVLFADFVVVNAAGDYLCHRKVLTPTRNHLWISHLPAFSCAMFFRRNLVSEREILFDPRLRAVGDGDWMLRLLHRRTPMAVLRRFTSVFTLHGENLGESATAVQEAARLHASAPQWVRRLKPMWILHHRLRRLVAGAYWQTPFTFSLYTTDSPDRRVECHVARPCGRWKRTLVR